MCHGTCEEARGVGLLLPLCAFQGRTQTVMRTGKNLYPPGHLVGPLPFLIKSLSCKTGLGFLPASGLPGGASLFPCKRWLP